jgi:hypothetical protein
MKTNRVSKVLVILGLMTAASLSLAASAAAQWDIQTYWECRRGSWSAYTNYRSMVGTTLFECGSGICDDSSHTQPTSWVDFTGGISQSQDDHSDSFFGPLSGEWDGCAAWSSNQVSTGVRWIESVNQGWDRWPTSWNWGQYWDQDISFLNESTDTMHSPYGSIYDLDCAPGWISWLWGGSCPKNIVGTVYWDNFPVTAHLAAGSPVATGTEWGYGSGYARWDLVGDTGVFCSTPASGCESVVCADLHVRSTFECTWTLYDPCQHIPPQMEIPSECIR